MSAEEYKLAAHALLHLKQFHTQVAQLNSIKSQKVFLNNVIVTENSSSEAQSDENSDNEISISLDADKIATQIRGCLSFISTLPELDSDLHVLLVDNPLLSDCRLIVNDCESYYGHKFFLTKGSSFFNAMLSNNFEESNKAEIKIELQHIETFKLALEFIYTGKINREYCDNEKWICDVETYFVALWTAVYLQIQEMINKLIQVFEYPFIISTKFTHHYLPFDLFMRILEGKLNTLRSKDKIIGAQPPMSECRNECRTTQIREISGFRTIPSSAPQNEYDCLWEMAMSYAGKCNDVEICKTLIVWVKNNNILRYTNTDRVKDYLFTAPTQLQACIDPMGVFQFLHGKSQQQTSIFGNLNLY